MRHSRSWLTRFRLAAAAWCLAWAGVAPPAFAGADAPATAPPADASRPAILVYHRFSTSAPPDSMTVRVSTFDAQLAFLRAHGYAIVPLRDVVAWAASPSASLPEKAVAITVDDGHRSVYELLRPIVLRERLPVTLFIYPSAISNASYAMTWDELRALRNTGRFDIESHTWWHPNFRTERRRLAPDAFRRFAATQFAHARALLEREVGGPVDLLAWPFGIYDDELTSLAAQAGYVAGFTLDARKVRRGDAPLALPRFLIVDSCTPAVLARMLGERGDAQTGVAFAARATAGVPAAGVATASMPMPDTPARAASSAASSTAPSAAIRGSVVDARTGKPIAAAIVTIGGHPIRADERGAFPADAAAAGIAVRAPGYLATRTSVEAGRPVTVALAPFRPKAVYLSVFGITSKTLREAAVDLKGATAINALVIDMKGDRGITPYPSAARRASGAAAQTPNAPVVRDFAALVAELRRRGLYLIARIVVFKDDPLAAAHPDWTVRDANGDIWRDREKLRWIDPSLRAAWAHNLDVAEEAAKLGFDEIQFDYVRFPDARGLRFSVPNTRANRTAAIAGFLQAARERLAPYNVFVAADIFGYVCWNEDDTAIGQQIETLGGPLDYISPMLYPSGFTWGLPGCTQPTADPGQIVRRSLAEARLRTGLPGVRFRPWLQAFRDYAFDRRDFAAAQIRAQVDAAEDAGTDGWMLWNARNRYDPQQLPK